MNLCWSVGKNLPTFVCWHKSHPLLGHFLCILWLVRIYGCVKKLLQRVCTRLLTAPKQMICSLHYLPEFYSHSTYFSVYRQIDNKKKCINPRIRDKTASVHPSVSVCVHAFIYFCECVSKCLSLVSTDTPHYRVILHLSFFSCVFLIYLPQTCHTQGDHEEIKLSTNMAFRK